MLIEADAGVPVVSANSSNSNPSSSSGSRISVIGESKRGESSFLLPPNSSSRQFYARASLKDSGGSENLHTFTTGLHHYSSQHNIMEEFLFRRVSSTQEIHITLHSLEDSTSVQLVVIPVSRLAEGIQISQWYQLFLIDTTTTNGHDKASSESRSPGSSIKLQIQFTKESEYDQYQIMTADLSTRSTLSEKEDEKDETSNGSGLLDSGRDGVVTTPPAIIINPSDAIDSETSKGSDEIDPPMAAAAAAAAASSEWRANELLTVGIMDYLLVFGPNYTTQSPSIQSPSIPWSPSPFVESEITLWDRFPTEDHEQLPLPPKIEYFACPEGSKVVLAKKRPKPTLSSFILSGNDADNNQQLGACLVVYMKLPYNNPPVSNGDMDDDADTRIILGGTHSDRGLGLELGIEVGLSIELDREGKREDKGDYDRRGLRERTQGGEADDYDRSSTKLPGVLRGDDGLLDSQREQPSCGDQTPFLGEPWWRRCTSDNVSDSDSGSDSGSGSSSSMAIPRATMREKRGTNEGKSDRYGEDDDNKEDLRTAGKERISQRWNWTAVTVCVISRWPFVRQLQQCLLATYHHNIFKTLEKWEKYYTLSTCCGIVSGSNIDQKPLRLSGLFGGLFASLCMECPLPRCGAFSVTIGIDSQSALVHQPPPLSQAQSQHSQQQSPPQQQSSTPILPIASASSSSSSSAAAAAAAAKSASWNPFTTTGQPPSKNPHPTINFTLPSQVDNKGDRPS